jgi:hypothetical protein
MTAQRRLRDKHLFGRAPEMQFVGKCQKILYLQQIHKRRIDLENESINSNLAFFSIER